MTRARPTPPVGKYPHCRLCDQRGKAPTSARIKKITKIVASIVLLVNFRRHSLGAPRRYILPFIDGVCYPTRIREREWNNPNTLSSHNTKPMTTTAFKIDLMLPAIGMNRFTSHSRTPTTMMVNRI